MSATIRQIVDDALAIVGEVDGIGVQTYGEDRMFSDAIRGFDLMFKKYPWPQYRRWYTGTLDGTTGVFTGAVLTSTKDFEDILSVHIANEVKELPLLPRNLNPNSIGSGGTRPMYWTSLHVLHSDYVDKKIQIYPITSEGDIDLHIREYPLIAPATEWDWADVWYLDRSLLAYATAFMTLSGDDLNASHAQTIKAMMESKYKDITTSLASRPMPIRGQSAIPDQYFIRP